MGGCSRRTMKRTVTEPSLKDNRRPTARDARVPAQTLLERRLDTGSILRRIEMVRRSARSEPEDDRMHLHSIGSHAGREMHTEQDKGRPCW